MDTTKVFYLDRLYISDKTKESVYKAVGQFVGGAGAFFNIDNAFDVPNSGCIKKSLFSYDVTNPNLYYDWFEDNVPFKAIVVYGIRNVQRITVTAIPTTEVDWKRYGIPYFSNPLDVNSIKYIYPTFKQLESNVFEVEYQITEPIIVFEYVSGSLAAYGVFDVSSLLPANTEIIYYGYMLATHP